MSEVTYYQDESVTVTNARAMLGGKTYAMANITSISMGTKPADHKSGTTIASIGLLLGGCLAAGEDTRIIGILVALLVIGAGIALVVMAKPSYIVRIGSASGEADGLVSKDREYIQKVVNAMNQAIIKRG